MESDMKASTSFGVSSSEGVAKSRPPHGRISGPTRRSTKGQWTPEEDEILRKAVQKYNGKNWKKIAECFKDRTDVQCLHRWQKVLNPELIKGPWSKEEDEKIIQLVNKYGPKKWSTIAQELPGRIGKQCRERWHNHLNPAINKDAWSQEEELILIRAHQIYGNKWAELTKFLPGRTDNAIKNHWNSSVKKKLPTYLASGLLSELPPLSVLPNQPVPSSSSRKHINGDDNCANTELEENSECSPEGSAIGDSQCASERTNLVLQETEELQLTQESVSGRDQTSSATSCSGQYYFLENVNISVPERPCEVGCCSKLYEQTFRHDVGNSSMNSQFDLVHVPNVSLMQWVPESSGMQSHCLGINENSEAVSIQMQNSVGLIPPDSVDPAMVCGTQLSKPISDKEICEVLFSDEINVTSFPHEDIPSNANAVSLGEFSGSLLCQSSGPLASCHESFRPAPQIFCNSDLVFIYNGECQLYGSEEGITTTASEGFICTNDSANSPCHDGLEGIGRQEQLVVVKDSPKLVPVNNFSPGSDQVLACPSVDEKGDSLKENQNGGGLCYEPPRFPSLDIPFFSCDLIESESDMQQDYSPLGIRRVMMTSLNCISPLRLWDSPARDKSPDAVLKSAAKTFTGTPSILKKRSRALFSPLSNKRSDKKLETGSTSSLTKTISRLDDTFDEKGPNRAPTTCSPSNLELDSKFSVEEKENLGHLDDNERDSVALVTSQKLPENGTDKDVSHEGRKHGTADPDRKDEVNIDATSLVAHQASGVLIERDRNDLQLFSPDKVACKVGKSLCSGTPKNGKCQISTGKCFSISSPSLSRKGYDNHSAPGSNRQANFSSVPLENMVDNKGKDPGVEGLSIFGETPFKRGIESPSAWKSPWLFNSFLSGPRIDTDAIVEDIGYYISPGGRTYDAIGLMKEISEHTAGAYAEAQEVLGDKSPETSLKRQRSLKKSNLGPKLLTECRALDFSECGTPAKRTEEGKSSSSTGFSSPASYLLKSCR